MAPPNPKRPPRPPRPPGQQASSDDPEELPFDDDEVSPLQADDPRPQRVPQYPAGPRKLKRRGPGERSKSDRELSPRYDWAKEYSDPGVTPAFVYVERGPGAGQLVPLHQGSITLGRSSTSDLRLQHASISRRHAQLTRRGNVFTVRDLGSQNGTFVNRLRIKGEVEIRPGDELSLGNATLRLRGSGAGPTVSRTSLDPLPRNRKRPLNGVAVAVAAAVVGSAVAALISVVAMRMADRAPARTPAEGAPSKPPANDARDTGREAPSKEARAVEAEAPAKAADVVSAVDVAHETREPTGSGASEGTTPSAADVARGMPTSTGPAKVLSASEIARGMHSGQAAPGTLEAARGMPAKTGEPQAGQVVAASARKEASSAEPSGPPDERQRADILSRYESGDVSGALAQARRANLTTLAQQLHRFQAAEASAKTALSQQDRPRALDALGAAVRLDQELAHGWSRQGVSLRRQLAGLYVRTGQDAVRAQRFADAREAFAAALQHDADNAEAREQLAALAVQAP
ncbi:FHA domain-containing protein [Corallococcus macrosporus]|uniref:FHA domain-containing protein n=1 Tax=Corallococcus macrosporus TaxID=35 RepID=A0ABS3DJY2_9BACT|nr:FHA domain-containing protein [Corallococcus macrosporus]MBN8231608.1 FHA domain-containing protein [Corallococcus macrosporus]